MTHKLLGMTKVFIIAAFLLCIPFSESFSQHGKGDGGGHVKGGGGGGGHVKGGGGGGHAVHGGGHGAHVNRGHHPGHPVYRGGGPGYGYLYPPHGHRGHYSRIWVAPGDGAPGYWAVARRPGPQYVWVPGYWQETVYINGYWR
jgi:hypothetical protein